MPSVICEPDDVICFTHVNSRPNFISSDTVTGPVIALTQDTPPDHLDGCIVAIENADPGYDWIFSRNIIGMVTKYSGVASHMAIRCAEFRLPAAIGCGEIYFDKVIRSRTLTLDCTQRVLVF